MTTQFLKELLHSTDIAEYTLAFDFLNTYLSDGGHTNFFPSAENSEDIVNQFDAILSTHQADRTGAQDTSLQNFSVQMSTEAIQAARVALYESADYVEQMKTSVYCEKRRHGNFLL